MPAEYGKQEFSAFNDNAWLTHNEVLCTVDILFILM